MISLPSHSLARTGRAGKAFFVLLAFALAMGPLRPALAQTEEPAKESPHDIRGMVIFKIPFGTTDRDQEVAPEIGLNFSVSRPEDEIRKPERYDPHTGAKLPQFDPEQVRTWKLDDSEPLATQLSTSGFGQSVGPDDPAGPTPRIKGLSKYGLTTIPDK